MRAGQRLVDLDPEPGACGTGMCPASTRIVPLISASWNGVSIVSAIRKFGIEAARWMFAAHSTGPA